jgi:hypothetical protein
MMELQRLAQKTLGGRSQRGGQRNSKTAEALVMQCDIRHLVYVN